MKIAAKLSTQVLNFKCVTELNRFVTVSQYTAIIPGLKSSVVRALGTVRKWLLYINICIFVQCKGTYTISSICVPYLYCLSFVHIIISIEYSVSCLVSGIYWATYIFCTTRPLAFRTSMLTKKNNLFTHKKPLISSHF